MDVKKKILLIVLGYILILSIFSGCTQKIKSDALSSLDYSNREFGFGLNPPNNWTLDENLSFENFVIFNCQQNETIVPVSMSINASVVNASDTMDSYFNIIIERNILNGNLPDYKLISRTDRTIHSSITTIAYENIYTYTAHDNSIIKVKNIMIEPKDDVIIFFEYITPVSTYSTYEYDFEFSLGSLTFL